MYVVGGKSRQRRRAMAQSLARNSGRESIYMGLRP
jgi:hypothetical protein